MNKYRAVVMVPTVIEFESGSLSHAHVQVHRLARGMGEVTSLHPRKQGKPYEPYALECVKAKDSKLDLIDYVTPGDVA